jgi:hypothetical protein
MVGQSPRRPALAQAPLERSVTAPPGEANVAMSSGTRLADACTAQSDGIPRALDLCRVGHRRSERCQGHARGGHPVGGMRTGPFDEAGHGAMAQPVAIPPHGDLPTQDAVRRLALEVDQLARVAPCGAQRGGGSPRISATRDEMDEPRLARDRRLQAAVVEVEPASPAGIGRERVDRDDLQVRGGMGWGADREHPVVRSHQAVLAAGAGRDAERGLAPCLPLVERLRGDDQVVDECGHNSMVPSMQVTASPPTHTWPPASRCRNT